MSQEIKRRFATLPPIVAMKMVRAGWELETQAVDGSTYSELCGSSSEPDFDENGWLDAVGERADRALSDANFAAFCHDECSELGGWSHNYRRGLRDACSAMAPHLPDDFAGSVLDAAELGLSGDADRALRRVRGTIQTLAESTVDRAPYYADYDSSDGDGELHLDLPRGVDAKEDGSVDGVEFVCSGNGCSAQEFGSRLRSLLRRFDLTVDTGCSFHVHLSVPGLRHVYGERLQASMMEYLLSQVHRVPTAVLKRWRSDTNYFKPEVSREKYSFVHFHAELGTWEFRCFGNVSTWKDGMTCLRLAVEALQFAYRVQLGLATSELSDSREWKSSILQDVVGTVHDPDGERIPVKQAIRKRRTQAA